MNHSSYIAVKHLAETGVREDWKKYCSKYNGRRNFQIDLAIEVMEYGIKKEWDDDTDDKLQPKWMRQLEFIPCNCDKCFFVKI